MAKLREVLCFVKSCRFIDRAELKNKQTNKKKHSQHMLSAIEKEKANSYTNNK